MKEKGLRRNILWRVLAAALAFCLLFTCTDVPGAFSVLAAAETATGATSGFCGSTANGGNKSDVKWEYDQANNKLTISLNSGIASANMQDYADKNDDWDSFRTSITTVEIGSGITKIGDIAFKGFTSLTSVNMPNTVKSIGDSAFNGCEALTSINIPSGVTSIGSGVFYNCTGLTSVNMPNTVKSIGDSAFNGCTGLTSVTIPNTVTSIGNDAFSGCTALTSITIPSGVTSIGTYAFYSCAGLTSIEIPSSVTSIGERAFYYCSGLTSIEIPSSVTSIGEKAFYCCSSLKRVFFKATTPPTIGSSVFVGCPFWQDYDDPTTGIFVPPDSVSDYEDVSSMFRQNMVKYTKFPEPDTNGQITLETGKNYYLTEDVTLTSTLTISGNVSLCLNGKTITYTGNDGIIKVLSGANFTLCDCGTGKLTGNDINCWGVFVDNGGTFNMYGGKITGCKATSYSGGGVFVNGGTSEISGGTFNMYGGTISGNTASNGGGVFVDGDNTTSKPRGTFNMYGGEISSNTTTNYGGGVYVNNHGTFSMSGGKISSNEAQSTKFGGGGVFVNNAGTFTMSGGTISGNTATKHGGGVYVASSGTFTMNSGTISGNKATDSDTVSHNESGGGVYNDHGIFNMNGGTISGNTADGSGGGVFTLYGTFNMSGSSKISDNIATDQGGGVYVNGGTFTMEDGKISNNTSNVASFGGGGVYVTSSGIFTMNGGEITGNKAPNTTGGGGGVYVTSSGTFTMSGGSKISSNNATKGNGGGVYVESSGTFTMFGDSTISGNNAKNGGGVYVDGDTTKKGTFTMSGGTISGNTATHGGGVYVGGKFEMSGDSKISGNTATYGGCVYVNGGTFEMKGGTISGNKPTASNFGGGVYVNSGTFNMSGDSKISGNTATHGGGVYVNSGTFTMSGDSTISGNKVSSCGGGVFVASSGIFNMNGGTIGSSDTNSGNTAAAGGGGVYSGGTFTMKGSSKISSNSTSSNGGGVYVADGTFEMSGGTISGNTATTSGGGVYVYASSKFEMSGDSKISGNTAANLGGGVYSGGTFTMSGGTISGNEAQSTIYGGGGVFVDNTGKFTMSGGTISGNTAKTTGGGVYVYGNGAFTINGTTNIIITGNKKTDGSANNVYLPSGKKITIGSSFNAGKTTVDVTTELTPSTCKASDSVAITDKEVSGGFSSDNNAYIIAYAEGSAAKLTKEHTYKYSVSYNIMKERCEVCEQHNAFATLTIPNDADLTYTGSAIEPATINYSGDKWVGTKPTISYAYNIDAGNTKTKAMINYGNIFGNKFFEIKPKSIEGFTVTIDSISYPLTGPTVEPDVTVKDGETVLVKGRDYTVSYSNNTSVGTATVTVTGTGNYKGSASKDFSIDKGWTLVDGKLTISAQAGMDDWANNRDSYASERSQVTSVVIADGVTSIGRSAFNGCSGLTSVTIPDSVTSIGSYAFYDCSGLTSVTIPNSVTNMGVYAFENCSGLTSVTIPASVTSIEAGTFKNCSGLTGVTIENGVTIIGNAVFENCSGLTSVTIPASVNNIGTNPFICCSGLTSIRVEADNANYKSENNAIIDIKNNKLVAGCKNTTIPSGVTSIGWSAFYGCSGLTSVTIPDSVTDIGNYAFYNCTKLTTVTMGPAVPPTLGVSAFSGCPDALKIKVSSCQYKVASNWSGYKAKMTPTSADTFHNGFSYTASNNVITQTCACKEKSGTATLSKKSGADLTYTGSAIEPFEVIYSAGWKTQADNQQGITYENNIDVGTNAKAKLTIGEATAEISFEITAPTYQVTLNGNGGSGDTALDSYTYGTGATLPTDWTKTGYNFDGWYKNSDFSGDKVTAISATDTGDKTFYAKWTANTYTVTFDYQSETGGNTTQTKTVTYGSAYGDLPAPKREGYTFAGWYTKAGSEGNLVKADTVVGTAENHTLYAHWVFVPVSVTVGDWSCVVTSDDSVKIVGYSGSDTAVEVPSVIDGKTVTAIGDNVFAGKTGITSVTIPDCVTAIGEGAFSGCTGLTTVIIPEGVDTEQAGITDTVAKITYKVEENGEITITSVTPGSDTAVEVPSEIGGKHVSAISDGAFADCIGLTTVIIPEGVDTENAGITDTTAKITYKDENGTITITSVAPGTGSGSGDKPVTIPDTIGGKKPEISKAVKETMKNIPHEHKGGTAACTQKAVCEICGEGYGDAAGHTLTGTGGVEPTCTVDGNIAYWTCSVCNKMFSDGNGTTEVTTVKIAASGHDWSGEWVVKEQPTPTKDGVEETACKHGCGATQQRAIPATGDGEVFSTVITSEGVKIVGYFGSDTAAVEVPSEIGDKTVTAIGENAFSGHTEITSVTIPNSVTEIGKGAFSGCTGLTTITIPGSVDTTNAGITDMVAKITYKDENGKITITSVTPGTGSGSGDKPVTIPDTIGGQKPEISDTVKETMKNILHEHRGGTADCTKKAVCEICGVEYGDSAGHTLVKTEGAEPTCTVNGRKTCWTCSVCNKMFSDGNGTTEVTAENVKLVALGHDWSGEWVVKEQPTATKDGVEETVCTHGCGEKKQRTIPATGDGEVFSTVITPEGVKIAGYSGSGTAAVEVPSVIDGRPVTAIGENVFAGHTEITSVTVPGSVKVIGEGAFAGCTGLTSIIIPEGVDTTSAGITDMVAKITYRDENGTITITSVAPGSVTAVEVPSEIGGRPVTAIGEDAFSGCTGLTSVTIPDSVTAIGKDAFSGCTGLTSVIIPDSVTAIGKDAFSGCTGLTSVTIPDSVTAIGEGAFSGCTGLTSVTIPNSVTAIGKDAFSGCTGLTTIIIPENLDTKDAGITDTVAKITYTVDGNGKITITSVTPGTDSNGGKKPVTIPDTIGGQKPEISDTVKDTMKGISHEHKGGTATCIQKAVCEICGVEYGDFAEHTLAKTEGVEPTRTADGNMAYWTCSKCGKKFSDEKGVTEITDPTIPATGNESPKSGDDSNPKFWILLMLMSMTALVGLFVKKRKTHIALK